MCVCVCVCFVVYSHYYCNAFYVLLSKSCWSHKCKLPRSFREFLHVEFQGTLYSLSTHKTKKNCMPSRSQHPNMHSHCYLNVCCCSNGVGHGKRFPLSLHPDETRHKKICVVLANTRFLSLANKSKFTAWSQLKCRDQCPPCYQHELLTLTWAWGINVLLFYSVLFSAIT